MVGTFVLNCACLKQALQSWAMGTKSNFIDGSVIGMLGLPVQGLDPQTPSFMLAINFLILNILKYMRVYEGI